MSVLVKSGKFGNADFDGFEISNDLDREELRTIARRESAIAIPFPSFADGRGFSIAQRLRRLGFTGTLRARGHVLADQYPLALRSGFDEVEISDELAARQGEAQWLEAFSRINNTYLERLKQGRVADAA